MSRDVVREEWNRKAMQEHALDALICRLPENVLLLSGYWPLSPFCWILVPREGPSTLIVAHTEEAELPEACADEVVSYRYGTLDAEDPYRAVGQWLRHSLHAARLEHGRIGYEGTIELIAIGHNGAEARISHPAAIEMVRACAPDAHFEDAAPALHAARSCKTPAEIKLLRRAGKVAAFGLQAFRDLYEPGRTEAEVAAGVEAAVQSRGTAFERAREARAWAYLMTGPRSAHAYSVHPYSSGRRIGTGDLGVLEIATVVDGYWSDLTRTLVAGGEPSEPQSEMYDAIIAASQAVLRAAKPQMTGSQVDSLARREIGSRGLGHFFLHHTGHGVGFRYHESSPFLHPANGEKLIPGMVSSVEPGLYVEGFGGMRLEENVVMTATGLELLSAFPVALGRA